MSREHWDRQAANWAAWARTPNFDAYWQYSKNFFELVPSPRALTLEVGCGEGRVTRDLQMRGHQVVGVDATAALVKLANEADPQGKYIRCDAAALPFPAATFDLTVFYNSLMDIDEMEASVLEAARVLRPGGALCACVTHPMTDAGRFQSHDPESPFVIESSYLGERRWVEAPMERGGLSMHFAGWAYPLEGYFGALERAGFVIEAVREPADVSNPRWRRIPTFLMWRARKTK